MPSRILREGIITSERVNGLSVDAELFYRRLMSVADDYGRYYAHPGLLRAACYPLRLDTVTEQYVKRALSECVAAGLLLLYGGGKYLQLADFRQQTRSKSKFPQPSDDELLNKCKANVHLVGVGVGVGVEGEGGGEVVVPHGSPPQLQDEASTEQIVEFLQSSHAVFAKTQAMHIAAVIRKYAGEDKRKIVEAVRTLVVHYAGDADLGMPAPKRLDTYLRREVSGIDSKSKQHGERAPTIFELKTQADELQRQSDRLWDARAFQHAASREKWAEDWKKYNDLRAKLAKIREKIGDK